MKAAAHFALRMMHRAEVNLHYLPNYVFKTFKIFSGKLQVLNYFMMIERLVKTFIYDKMATYQKKSNLLLKSLHFGVT